LVFFEGKELEKALLGAREPTRGESGNCSYVLHPSNDNPDELLSDGIWTDKDALKENLNKKNI
jgi:quinol monooxygenase YgiN